MAITNSNEDYSQMDKTNITSEAILNLNSVKNNYDSNTQIPIIFIEPLNLILFNGKFYGDNNFWIGTCTTAKATLNKVATVEGDFKLRKGVSVLIKFSATNTAAANATLNVNNTGDYVIYYNAAPITSKGAAGGVANKYILYVFDGTYWVAQVGDINSDTKYSTITVAEITGATATAGRLISAKLLTDELNKKVDIISGATDGNFAAIDANGNLTDSGHKHSDYLTSHQDISGKADKVSNAINGNFAALDSNGNLTDSGHKHGDYLTEHQDLSNYVQKSNTSGLLKNDGTVDTTQYLSQHQDISGKADKSEMSVVPGTGADTDKTTITLKQGVSASVLTEHQDISEKADKMVVTHSLNGADGDNNPIITKTKGHYDVKTTFLGQCVLVSDGGGVPQEIEFTMKKKGTLQFYARTSESSLSSVKTWNNGSLMNSRTFEVEIGDVIYMKSVLISTGVDAVHTVGVQYLNLTEVYNLSDIADSKVDKEADKGLSSNDYTDEDKEKLGGIAEGATANIGTITGITMNGSNKGKSGTVNLGTVVTGITMNGNTKTVNNGICNLGTVLTSHQDISGKTDKVNGATNGNFAALDANGNLIDSGHKHSDYLTSHQDISGKTDKVNGATNGNFAALDANGNLIDSGHKHSDYLTSHQDISGKEDTTVIQTVTSGTTAITTTVNTYYNVEGTVTSLTITLPVPTDTTKISVIIIHLTTGSTASVIFSSTATVDHINSYNVLPNKEYELKCWYNGSKWVVSSSEII